VSVEASDHVPAADPTRRFLVIFPSGQATQLVPRIDISSYKPHREDAAEHYSGRNR
jgi:hypothetical protein